MLESLIVISVQKKQEEQSLGLCGCKTPEVMSPNSGGEKTSHVNK